MGEFFAFLAVNEGKGAVARQKLLKVGDTVGNDYAVMDGIKPGDHIITSGIAVFAGWGAGDGAGAGLRTAGGVRQNGDSRDCRRAHRSRADARKLRAQNVEASGRDKLAPTVVKKAG